LEIFWKKAQIEESGVFGHAAGMQIT